MPRPGYVQTFLPPDAFEQLDAECQRQRDNGRSWKDTTRSRVAAEILAKGLSRLAAEAPTAE